MLRYCDNCEEYFYSEDDQCPLCFPEKRMKSRKNKVMAVESADCEDFNEKRNGSLVKYRGKKHRRVRR